LTNNDGVLKQKELIAALHDLGVAIPVAKRVAVSLDYTGNGRVEYLEFAAACLTSLTDQEFEELLSAEFNALDRQKRGVLTQQEVEPLLRKLRLLANKRSVKIPDFDADDDGNISFKSFYSYFGLEVIQEDSEADPEEMEDRVGSLDGAIDIGTMDMEGSHGSSGKHTKRSASFATRSAMGSFSFQDADPAVMMMSMDCHGDFDGSYQDDCDEDEDGADREESQQAKEELWLKFWDIEKEVAESQEQGDKNGMSQKEKKDKYISTEWGSEHGQHRPITAWDERLVGVGNDELGTLSPQDPLRPGSQGPAKSEDLLKQASVPPASGNGAVALPHFSIHAKGVQTMMDAARCSSAKVAGSPTQGDVLARGTALALAAAGSTVPESLMSGSESARYDAAKFALAKGALNSDVADIEGFRSADDNQVVQSRGIWCSLCRS
jgi:Ca2+-binding EF-hand superfamily protein